MAKGGGGKVISMAEKMYIKQLYEGGVSKSEIQRRTKVNYRTVCKYADMEDWNDDKLPNMEPDNYPVLGEYIPLIIDRLVHHSHIVIFSGESYRLQQSIKRQKTARKK